METATLLTEVEAFLADTGMGPTYFGTQSCGNSELVGRLRKGKTVLLPTAEAVLAYIHRERAARNLPKKEADKAAQDASAPEGAAAGIWKVA